VLSLRDLGWIQVTNFIVAGLLVVACAFGLRRGRAGTWGPLLVGVYGLGLVGAGLFSADAVPGFPPGTTPATQFSTHGALHLLFSSVAFLSLVAASAIVFARRFATQGERRWATYSVATGVYFLGTWIALFLTQGGAAVANLAFATAVVLAWTWLAVVAARLLNPGHRPAQ
jgi:hypothetical membrane protein